MLSRFSLLIWIFVFSVVYADPSTDEDAFLDVPGAVPVTGHHQEMQVFKAVDLPKELMELLKGYDFVDNDGSFPADFSGFSFDLNKDGRNEYFIYNRACSGSGGSAFLIFSKVGKNWKFIGDFQGGLHMFPVHKGWPRLVCITRGGGGCWSKSYMEFQHGEYKGVASEHYDRGTITWVCLPRK